MYGYTGIGLFVKNSQHFVEFLSSS